MRSLLRDYIDRLRAESNSRIVRARTIIDDKFSSEMTAPLLAPRWTRAGYNGQLNDAIIKACNDHNEDRGNEGNEEESILLTGEAPQIQQLPDISDDEYLEMDD